MINININYKLIYFFIPFSILLKIRYHKPLNNLLLKHKIPQYNTINIINNKLINKGKMTELIFNSHKRALESGSLVFAESSVHPIIKDGIKVG